MLKITIKKKQCQINIILKKPILTHFWKIGDNFPEMSQNSFVFCFVGGVGIPRPSEIREFGP